MCGGVSPPSPKQRAEREQKAKRRKKLINKSKYKVTAATSITMGFILFFAGFYMAGRILGTDLLLVYLMDALMFAGLIVMMFGVLAGIAYLKLRPKNQMRTVLLSSFVLLTIMSVTFVPNVFAYVSSPIQSGSIYDEYYSVGKLCANYATLTRYDAGGGGNDPFFFPGVESHSDSGNVPYYWVTNLKITVTGTKPDGSPISGLEFTNLAALDSPHDTGSDPWYGVLAVLLDVLDDLSPPGASPLLKNGQSFTGVGYDGSSAWGEWQWNGVIATRTNSKGLQFRFSLHCDPDLEGIYTLNIHYRITIHAATPSGGYVIAAVEDIYETITYYFGSPKLSISASSGGSTDPASGTYTYSYGSSVTVTASAHSGYAFDYWLLDGGAYYQNPITVTMDADHTLTAYFDHGGGCPYVYTWDGQQYVMDNNLLPASEMSNGADVEDRYTLEQPLVPIHQGTAFSLYSLQIREFEHEHDFIDQVKLIALDHASDVKIVVTPKGEILTYRQPLAPLSCIDNDGTSRLDEVVSMDGNVSDTTTYFEGYPSDYLILNFGKVDAENAKLILRDDMKCMDVCIEVQVPSGSGDWQTVEVLNPRNYWAIEAVNLTAYIPEKGDFMVRLLWTAPHRLDYVGLDTAPQANIQVHEAKLLNALSSSQGDVTRLLKADDEKYAELLLGQQIQLTFQLPTNQNSQRTFILYAEGHYSTIAP
jgi:hypothetical protein